MMARTAGSLAACVMLCACSGSLFKSRIEPSAAYLLSVRGDMPPTAATPGGADSRPVPADLSILKPRMRPGLDSDRIAALYPDRRLEFYAGGRWSGTLDEVLQNLAVQIFQQRSKFRSVSTESTRFNSDYWLEIDVQDFEAVYSSGGAGHGPPTIKVRLTARLGGGADRDGAGYYEAQSSQIAADDRLGPIVDAFERAANDALGQILEGTNAALRPLQP